MLNLLSGKNANTRYRFCYIVFFYKEKQKSMLIQINSPPDFRAKTSVARQCGALMQVMGSMMFTNLTNNIHRIG